MGPLRTLPKRPRPRAVPATMMISSGFFSQFSHYILIKAASLLIKLPCQAFLEKMEWTIRYYCGWSPQGLKFPFGSCMSSFLCLEISALYVLWGEGWWNTIWSSLFKRKKCAEAEWLQLSFIKEKRLSHLMLLTSVIDVKH